MDNIINMIIASFFFLSAIYGFLFYTGRIKFSDEKERLRRDRVEKYKWLFIISIIIICLSGLGMFVATLSRLIG